MQILDAADVKGTFFEVGKAIDAEPADHPRRCTAHGQLLGNHSYHHDQWRWLDPRYPELERTPSDVPNARSACARRSTGRRTAIARRSSRTS